MYLVAVGGRRTPRFLFLASTDNDGKYEIKDIVEGEATLVVVERWFAHGRVEGIPIVAGETARIDLVLGGGTGINGGVSPDPAGEIAMFGVCKCKRIEQLDRIAAGSLNLSVALL